MNSHIPAGKARFLYFLHQAGLIFAEAEKSDNQGWTIYTQGIRTSFFMLEALSRLYKKIHNHKDFSKLNKWFKAIEDLLGQVDFYDAFYKEFSGDTKIPTEIIEYFKESRDKKLKELNSRLKEKHWINSDKRMKKILAKLDEANWLDDTDDTEAIKTVFKKGAEKILGKYKVPGYRFQDIEADVHEFRRQLRWLSIYPQALRGLVQLYVPPTHKAYFTMYLTPEILHSPYNKMPKTSKSKQVFTLNGNCFYALSWMIDRLGQLKDSGLKISALEDSLRTVYDTEGNTESLAYSLSGKDQLSITAILSKAQQITDTFFKEDILENLFNVKE